MQFRGQYNYLSSAHLKFELSILSPGIRQKPDDARDSNAGFSNTFIDIKLAGLLQPALATGIDMGEAICRFTPATRDAGLSTGI